MMRPCSYNEAWGSTITSHKSRHSQESPGKSRRAQITAAENEHQKWMGLRRKSQGGMNTDSHDCSTCLLHIISCPMCQAKLQQLSKLYLGANHEKAHERVPNMLHPYHLSGLSNDNGSNNAIENRDHVDRQRYSYECSPFLQSFSPEKSDPRYIDSVNNLYMYILIGIILGYIISQMISKKI